MIRLKHYSVKARVVIIVNSTTVSYSQSLKVASYKVFFNTGTGHNIL